MEVVRILSIALFVGAWLVALISWFYSLYEFVSMHRFRASTFTRGRLVFQESAPFPIERTTIDTGRVYKTRIGKFQFLNPRECLFCLKFQIFSLRIQTPFPIKGRIRLDNGVATIEGRIPLGTTIFLGAWLVGWTVGGLMFAVMDPAVAVESFGFTAVGWLFAGAIYFVSLPIELGRARRIVEEIRAQVLSK